MFFESKGTLFIWNKQENREKVLKKNMVRYIKFPPSWGKITTITKSFSIFVLRKKSKAASFSASVRPLWGRLERVLQLSAGSIPFGHSTSGYWKLAPFGDRRLFAKLECFIKLLPLQGAGRNAMIPRAMPWATSFCPFRACGASRKGAAEIYMLLLPYSFVSSHHRKVSKYTLHLERLQFFFCQSSYLHDLRPRHTHCQQVTGYFQTFR